MSGQKKLKKKVDPRNFKKNRYAGHKSLKDLAQYSGTHASRTAPED